ncbi:MAG TPA: dTDP-4-dehydrorhamnose reductase [Williamwhitmania sp.]|nr:dTDP-4-dehydrorhamnose reductase [Williamwhitmania sp.]
MKILVTGSNGQLGSELQLIAQHDNSSSYVFTDIQELDITSDVAVASFLAESKPDIIINCAAYTAVDKAETDIRSAELVNFVAPTILSKACLKSDIGLIHISTDYVFDGTAHLPYNEESDVNPTSVYGKSKLDGERAVLNAGGIVVRTSWLYSSHGNNFVKTMMRLGKEKESIGVVFDQVGTPTWAYNLAEVLITIAKKSTHDFKRFSGIYHYSNEGVCSWYDFAIEIMALTNSPCKVSPIETKEYPVPAPRPAYSVLNKRKIKDTFQIEIPHWKESLKKCVKLLSQ